MKMKIIIIIISLFLSQSIMAQTRFQTGFNEKEGISIIELKYSWSGFKKSNNNISFIIDKDELKNSYGDFKKPLKEDVKSYVNELLIQDMAEINKSQSVYKIEMDKVQNEKFFKYKIYGKQDAVLIDKINKVLKYRERKYTEDYFKKNYFLYNDKDSLVSIDYSKISNLYIPKMRNIANAFKLKNNKNIYDKRIVINDILSFYQSIPYDTLDENRGQGFSTPLKFLHENKGDCDTKLVAINATVKSLYPEIKTIAIILPNHVLMGFSIPNIEKGDKKVIYNGTTYVLTETAGPALIPLGVLDPKNESTMMSRNYSITEL